MPNGAKSDTARMPHFVALCRCRNLSGFVRMRVFSSSNRVQKPLSLLKIRSGRKREHAREGESFGCDQAEAGASEIAHGFHPNQKEQFPIKKGVLDVAPVGVTASTVSAKGHAARR
jgi:hypothetical protein